MGAVRLIEVHSEQLDEANLINYGDLNLQTYIENAGAITTLSFDIYSKNLAIATETGSICIYDIEMGKIVNIFNADLCGVNQLKFKSTNTLITAGNSFSGILLLPCTSTSMFLIDY